VDVRDEGSRTTVVLADGDTRMAVVHVVGPQPPDLTVVSAVARLRLMALRMGWTVRIENPCFHLCELLELTGLSDVLLAPRQRRPGDEPCPDAGPGVEAELEPWPRLDLEDLLAGLREGSDDDEPDQSGEGGTTR
jgi:hypothetical protein